MSSVDEKAIVATLAKAAMVRERDISDDTELYKLGVNSFDLIALICTFEDMLGVEIPEDSLGKMNLQTVGDLKRALMELQKG